VNDPGTVSSIECIGDLDSEREQRLQLHRAVADQVLQRCAIQKLHGDERLLLADVVDRADVWVVQCAKLGESLSSVQKFNVPIEATTSSLEALKTFSMGVATQGEKGDAEA